MRDLWVRVGYFGRTPGSGVSGGLQIPSRTIKQGPLSSAQSIGTSILGRTRLGELPAARKVGKRSSIVQRTWCLGPARTRRGHVEPGPTELIARSEDHTRHYTQGGVWRAELCGVRGGAASRRARDAVPDVCTPGEMRDKSKVVAFISNAYILSRRFLR
eukprot:7383110-Prymnesium_polylepis.1